MGTGKVFRLVIACLIAIGTGCSPPGPKMHGTEEGTGAPGLSEGTTAATAKSEPPGHEAFIVTLAPAVPTSTDSVRATLRSAASHREGAPASWKWFVNGIEKRIASDSMAAGSAQKGDEIQVEATIARPGGTVAVRSGKVRMANALPRVAGVELSNLSPGKGDTLAATASSQDPDGDAIRLTYRWRINGKVAQEGESPELGLSTAKKGDEVFCEVIPNDGEATGPTLTTPIVTVRNSPPVIRSTPPVSQGQAGPYVYTVVVEDPDGDDLRVELSDKPEGAAFDRGTFRWDPPAGFLGTVRVEFRVTDGAGGEARQEFTLQAREN